MNPEGECRIHKDSQIIPIPSQINPIPRIDTYFFKIHFNIVLQSTPRPSQRSLSSRRTRWECSYNKEKNLSTRYPPYFSQE